MGTKNGVQSVICGSTNISFVWVQVFVLGLYCGCECVISTGSFSRTFMDSLNGMVVSVGC